MLALLVALTLAPTYVFAQRDLALLHDSLQRIDDPSTLRDMIAHRGGRQAERNPELLTERGLIGMRLYELTSSRPDGKTAQRAFERAIEQAPRYGWAHYGLGWVLAHGPDASPVTADRRKSFVLDDVIARAFGNDAPTRARRAFMEAVNGQPPVPQAATELAAISTKRWSRKTLERSLAALEELNAAPHANADSWLALAYVRLELGRVDEAATALDKAVEHGVERTAGARARAMILFQHDAREKQGATAWFEAVDYAGSDMLDLLVDDVVPLLNKDERQRVKQLDASGKRQYLRAFWDMRAALAGVTVEERLAEHYRRVAVARRLYWRNARYGAPAGDPLLLRSFADHPYDDRGTIYIRHGEPLELLRSVFSEPRLEAWVYRDVNGQHRTLHFAAMQSVADYDLVHKLPCGADYRSTRPSGNPHPALPANCGTITGPLASADYRHSAYELLATDSDQPNFTKDLPFYFDLYTFRGEEGRTNVVAAVAVPVEKLQKKDIAMNPAYRVDLSLILVDTASRRVIRQDDSVALAATRAFKNDDLFRMHVEVAVPPSRTTLQRVIVSDPSEPGIGQLYGGPFPIPDYSVPKLMMSDIVLAEPRVEGRWHRGDVKLALVPTGRFKGASFRAFYELYNIPNNTAYSTEIEIEPLQKSAGQKLRGLFGGKSKISLKFDGVAMDVKNNTLQELRQVDAQLGPGKYRMRVTVRLESGETVRGERVFAVPED
jgi:hypothetical protein